MVRFFAGVAVGELASALLRGSVMEAGLVMMVLLGCLAALWLSQFV